MLARTEEGVQTKSMFSLSTFDALRGQKLDHAPISIDSHPSIVLSTVGVSMALWPRGPLF